MRGWLRGVLRVDDERGGGQRQGAPGGGRDGDAGGARRARGAGNAGVDGALRAGGKASVGGAPPRGLRADAARANAVPLQPPPPVEVACDHSVPAEAALAAALALPGAMPSDVASAAAALLEGWVPVAQPGDAPARHVGCSFGLPAAAVDALAAELAAAAAAAAAGDADGRPEDADAALRDAAALVRAIGAAARSPHCRERLARRNVLLPIGVLTRRGLRSVKGMGRARGSRGDYGADVALVRSCALAAEQFALAAAGIAGVGADGGAIPAYDAERCADCIVEAGACGTFVEALRAARAAGARAGALLLQRDALRAVDALLRCARLRSATATAGAEAVLLEGLGWTNAAAAAPAALGSAGAAGEMGDAIGALSTGATSLAPPAPSDDLYALLDVQLATVGALSARPDALVGAAGVAKLAEALQWVAWSFGERLACGKKRAGAQSEQNSGGEVMAAPASSPASQSESPRTAGGSRTHAGTMASSRSPLARMREAISGLIGQHGGSSGGTSGASGRVASVAAAPRVVSAAIKAVSLPLWPCMGRPAAFQGLLEEGSVALQREVVMLLREAMRDTATGGATRAALRALGAWGTLLGHTCYAFGVPGGETQTEVADPRAGSAGAHADGPGTLTLPDVVALRQDVMHLLVLACTDSDDVEHEVGALLGSVVGGDNAVELPLELRAELSATLREVVDSAADNTAVTLIGEERMLPAFAEAIDSTRAMSASMYGMPSRTSQRRQWAGSGTGDDPARIAESIVADIIDTVAEGGNPSLQGQSAGSDAVADEDEARTDELRLQLQRSVILALRAVLAAAGRCGCNGFAAAAGSPQLSAALTQCASEPSSAAFVLPLLCDLLTAPSQSDAELPAREALLRQTLELLPRAQHHARDSTGGCRHLLELLYLVRSALLANRALLQPLVCAVDGYVPVVSVLNEEYGSSSMERDHADVGSDEMPILRSEGLASAVSTAVLSTLVAALRESEDSKAAFARLVGYDTLESAVLRCHGGRPTRTLLRGLLALACDDIGAGDFNIALAAGQGASAPLGAASGTTAASGGTSGGRTSAPMVVANDAALCVLLRVARRAPDGLQGEALAAVSALLQDSTTNRLAAERAELGTLLLEWLPEAREDSMDAGPSIRSRVSTLLCAAASGSFSARDARRAVAMLRPADDPPPHALVLIESLTAMAERSKVPSAYFDMNGKRSGLQLSSGMRWPSSKGYAFATWLRLNEPAAGAAVMDMLRTPGKTTAAYIPMSPSDADVGLDERGFFSFAAGEGSGVVATLIRGGDIMVRTSGRKDDGAIFSTGIGPGNWHHVVVTHAASRGPLASPAVCKVYVDGTLVASTQLRFPKTPPGDGGLSAGGIACGGAGGVVWKHAEAAKAQSRASAPQGDSGVPPPWMGATPLGGQLGSVYLFHDALSDLQVKALHLMGSSYRHTFLPTECGVAPVSLESVKAALEGKDSLANRLAACFVATAADASGSACVNTAVDATSCEAGSAHGARVMPGTQLRSTRGLRDAMHAIGGASVFTPLLTCTPKALASRDSRAMATSVHSATVRLIASMLDGAAGSRSAFNASDGTGVISHLLSRLPHELLTADLLRATQALERCCMGATQLRVDVVRRLVLNYELWWQAPDETRLPQLELSTSTTADMFAAAGGCGALIDAAAGGSGRRSTSARDAGVIAAQDGGGVRNLEDTDAQWHRDAQARKAVVSALTTVLAGDLAPPKGLNEKDAAQARMPSREDVCACLAIALDSGGASRPAPPSDLASGALCAIAAALLRPNRGLREVVLGCVGGYGGAALAGAMMRPRSVAHEPSLPDETAAADGRGDVGPVALAGLAFLVAIVQAVSDEIDIASTAGTSVPSWVHQAIKGPTQRLSAGVNVGAREFISEATAVLMSNGPLHASALMAVTSALAPIQKQTAAVEAVLSLASKCTDVGARAAAIDAVASWQLGETLARSKSWQELLLPTVICAASADSADRCSALNLFAAAHAQAIAHVRGGWRVVERSVSCIHAAAARGECDGYSLCHEMLAPVLRAAARTLTRALHDVGSADESSRASLDSLQVEDALHNAVCVVALADELTMGDVQIVLDCLTTSGESPVAATTVGAGAVSSAAAAAAATAVSIEVPSQISEDGGPAPRPLSPSGSIVADDAESEAAASDSGFEIVDGEEAAATAAAAHAPRPAGQSRLVSLQSQVGSDESSTHRYGRLKIPVGAKKGTAPEHGWEVCRLACDVLSLWHRLHAALRTRSASQSASSGGSAAHVTVPIDLRTKAKDFVGGLFSSATAAGAAALDAASRGRNATDASKSSGLPPDDSPHADAVVLTGGAGAPLNATGEGLAGAVLRIVVLCAVAGPVEGAAAAAVQALSEGAAAPVRPPRGADAKAVRRRADRVQLTVSVLEEAQRRVPSGSARHQMLGLAVELLKDNTRNLVRDAILLERGGMNVRSSGANDAGGDASTEELDALEAELKPAWARRGLASEARTLLQLAKVRRDAAGEAMSEWASVGQRSQRAYEAIAGARSEAIAAVLAGDAERRAAAAAARDEAVSDGAIRWRELQREFYQERGPWAAIAAASSLDPTASPSRKANHESDADEGRSHSFEWRMDKVEDSSRRRLRLKLTTALSAAGGRKVASSGSSSPSPGSLDARNPGSAAGTPSKPSGEDLVSTGKEFAANCSLVTVKRVIHGRLRVDARSGDLVFRPHADAADVARAPWNRTRRWALRRLAEVRMMRYQLRPCAFEISLDDRRTAFFAFDTRITCRAAAERVAKARPGGSITVTDRRRAREEAERACARWRSQQISTFDYLMALNTLAGRTFNDAQQYPVFPWVIADYTSDELDLKAPSTFRDLSKPVGAINPDRRDFVLERYNSFEDPEGIVPKFHYGSHYSSAGAVLYYMIRLQPFHWLHRELQGGKLDHADRLFHSVGATWDNVLTNSSDVKEVIPEWYYQPEMFRNLGGYDLGTRQDGAVLGDVLLPPWAHGSPEELVRLNREALESDYVSARIHEWVDLIFGFKQTGKAAEEACNVFYYLTYEGAVDVDAIEDERERESILAQVREFGQTPAQLFKRAHAARSTERTLRRPLRDAPQMLEPAGAALPAKNSRVAWALSTIVLSPDGRVLSVDTNARYAMHRWITPQTLSSGAFSFAAGGQAAAYSAGGARCALEPDPQPPRTLRGGGVAWSSANGSAGVSEARAVQSAPAMHFAAPPSLRFVLSAGHWDNAICAVSAENGRLLQRVVAHKDAVTSLAMSSDGSVAVSGSADTTVMLWDTLHAARDADKDALPLASTPRAVLRGHKDAVVALAVDADLDLVASGGADGCCILHALHSGQYLRALHPDTGLSAGPAALVAIAGGVVPCVVVYTANDLSVRSYTINGRALARGDARERLHALAVAPEGDVCVVGGDRGVVCVRRTHDLVTTRTLKPPQASAGVITALHVSREEAVLAGTAGGALCALALGVRASKQARGGGEDGTAPSAAHRAVAATGLPGQDLLRDLL